MAGFGSYKHAFAPAPSSPSRNGTMLGGLLGGKAISHRPPMRITYYGRASPALLVSVEDGRERVLASTPLRSSSSNSRLKKGQQSHGWVSKWRLLQRLRGNDGWDGNGHNKQIDILLRSPSRNLHHDGDGGVCSDKPVEVFRGAGMPAGNAHHLASFVISVRREPES